MEGYAVLEKLEENKRSFYLNEAIDMSEMFYGCTKLGSLDVSGFDTENVEIIRDIFNGCENIEELDISLFATSNVANMDNMFDGMNMLAEITLGKNFFFNGKKCWLPTPSDAYIPGATGKWYDNKGNEYAVEDVPDNMEATYYAVKPVL